jgi:hypothetical protein
VDRTIEQVIDDEIQQLTDLKRLAKNPKMVELMRRLVAASSNGGEPETPKRTMPAPPSRNLTKPNGLSDQVLAAVRDLKRNFSSVDVMNHVLQSGFEFVSKNPRSAVVPPLDKMLKKKGIIRIARKGVGNQPALYDYVGEKDLGAKL